MKVRKQHDSMQCGITCLQMVCRFFGREYSLDSLSKICFATTEGVSMLGINYRKIESNSVGYKSDYEMFSLDFEEFLWAKGYDETFIEDMLEHMRNLTPFNEVQMSVCSSLFLDYCILGGMPAVVREFIVKGTFEGSLEIQRQLIADYKEDALYAAMRDHPHGGRGDPGHRA